MRLLDQETVNQRTQQIMHIAKMMAKIKKEDRAQAAPHTASQVAASKRTT